MRARTRPFVRAASAFCALVVSALLPCRAAADEFVPALRSQTGVTLTRSPGNDSNDFFVMSTPELGYFFGNERTQVGITYSFTGSLNTELPNTIANRLALSLAHDVNERTRLLFGLEALQTSVGNYLLVKRTVQQSTLGGVGINSQLLTTTATQAISHEMAPNVRLLEAVSGTYVRSLDPIVRLDNVLATAAVGVERSWAFDAVGGELALQYGRVMFPPLESTAITVSLGPTWDHDFSRSWSSSLGAGVALAVSPDPGTKPLVAPTGRASVLYFTEGSGVELAYAGGFEPNVLLGTIVQSNQVTLRAFTPISDEYRVLFTTSSGYLRAKVLDLRTKGRFDNEFDAVLHDAELSWSAADWLTLYLRYQFVGQTAGSGLGAGATPPLVRHGALFGIDIFGGGRPTRPRVQTKFPQRVDQQDKPLPDKRR